MPQQTLREHIQKGISGAWIAGAIVSVPLLLIAAGFAAQAPGAPANMNWNDFAEIALLLIEGVWLTVLGVGVITGTLVWLMDLLFDLV